MFTIFIDLFRLIRAASVLARHDALIPKEFAQYLPWPLRMLGVISRIGAKGSELRPGQRLATALSGQGPAYVKFGQLLATRPDIIGFEMADDLGQLQDRMPPFPQEDAIKEVEASLGKPVSELFSSFSEPIAAASVAQVHKAVTKGGEEIAIKVLRPQIEEKAKQEFRAFLLGARIAWFFSKAARRMEPIKFIKTLSAAAEIELDLRMEAGAASELRENMADDEGVYIPNIIWDYSSRRVLAIEWVNGQSLGNMEALEKAGIDRNELAKKVMRVFLKQALEDGFFHADMHQGNMLIDDKKRLVLIDFGIMGRLDEMARRTYAEIIYGFIQRDYKRAAKAHFTAGYIEPHHSLDAFATALRAVGEPIFGRDSDMVDMSKVLQQLFDVTDIFGMRLRPELILLQRTMVVAEGVARALDPQINMWEAADPVVRGYITSRVGPKAFIEQTKKNAEAVMRLVEKFPEFAEAAEHVIDKMEKERAQEGATKN